MNDLEKIIALVIDNEESVEMSAENSRTLCQLIKDNPAAQEVLVDHLCLDMLLTDSSGTSNLASAVDLISDTESQANVSAGPSTSEPRLQSARRPESSPTQVVTEQAVRQDRFHFRVMVVLVSAVLVALGVNASLMWRNRASDTIGIGSTVPLTTTTPSGVAVLSRVIDVAWRMDSQIGNHVIPTEGSVLSKSHMKIDSGVLQIEFFNGASIVVEGPAEFEIRSDKSIVCQYGKLRAYVPTQAKGFAVSSPQSKVADLGTEFGLAVSKAGETQIHVFNGNVRPLRNDDRALGNEHQLSTGDGLGIRRDESITRFVSDSASFRGWDDLAVRRSDNQAARYLQWLDFSKRLKYDNRVLLYFDFENAVRGHRVLPDRSQLATTNAAIVGCEWSTGRWPMKRSLDFKRDSDRLAMKGLVGEFSQITFLAWIRVDSLPRGQSALLMTNEYGHGNPHWQLTSQGELELGVGHSDKATRRRNKFVSPRIVDSDRYGRWMHVATVYDSKEQTVRHFVNGKRISDHDLVTQQPLTFGNAEIGNWIVPRQDGNQPIRNFNGRMDEFALYKVALTDKEIGQLFGAGKP